MTLSKSASTSKFSLDDLWDVVLIGVVVATTFLGFRVAVPLAIGLMAAYVFNPSRLRQDLGALDRGAMVLLGLVWSFAIYMAILTVFRWVPYDDVHIYRYRGLEHPGEWIFMAFLFSISLVRFCGIQNLNHWMQKIFLPSLWVGVGFAICIYAFVYLKIGPENSACRTGLLTFNSNVFAFHFAAMAGFASAYFMARNPKALVVWIMLAIFTTCMVALTGSRMAIVSFVVVCLLIYGFISGRWLGGWALLAIVLVCSLALGFTWSILLECDFLGRFQVLSDAADMEKSQSTARRFELWKDTIAALQGNWAFGLGVRQDAEIAFPNAHIHSQYLSWALWGGVPALLLGLGLLLSMPFYGLAKIGWQGFAIGGAYTGFVGLYSLFDSVMYFAIPFGQFLVVFAFVAGVLHAMSKATK